jgi:hypothetical protein
MTKKHSPAAGLVASLIRTAQGGDQAAAVRSLIARRGDHIERLGLALREGSTGERIARLLPEFDDPMARFRDDVHPAITNARIAVHNAKIMGLFRSEGTSVDED